MIKKIFSKEIFFLPVLFLTLFVSVNKVNADINSAYASDFYSFYDDTASIDPVIVQNLINYYYNNFSSIHDYYYISWAGWDVSPTSPYNRHQYLVLYALDDNKVTFVNGRFSFNDASYDKYCYSYITSTYETCASYPYGFQYLPYDTNTNFTFLAQNNPGVGILYIPQYSNLGLGISFPQYELTDGYVIPTYISLSGGTYIPNVNDPNSGGNSLIISDLFTNPIQTLESVWTSIVNTFNLIGEFITLIPSPLREFLISAFMLAIILGILKILL